MKFLHWHARTHELLQDWAGDQRLVTASYFFRSAGTPMQNPQEGLFRTLLSRIFIKTPEIAPLIYSKRWKDDRVDDWSHADLCSVFQRLSVQQELPTRFCFFIDGLDEYDGDHYELVKLLLSLSFS